jgi:hypothetical protein
LLTNTQHICGIYPPRVENFVRVSGREKRKMKSSKCN